MKKLIVLAVGLLLVAGCVSLSVGSGMDEQEGVLFYVVRVDYQGEHGYQEFEKEEFPTMLKHISNSLYYGHKVTMYKVNESCRVR